METIDPVCLFHGKKRSEHFCLVCDLCYKDLEPEECWEDENGVKWNICRPCKKHEDEMIALHERKELQSRLL